jgi:hypothetical protein
VPHPTLVAVGMGIAMSVLAVLVLTAIDVSFPGQEAEAYYPREMAKGTAGASE